MGRGHQHTLSMTSAGQILRQVACPARIATEERIHLFAPFPIKQGTYRIDHGSPLHRKSSPNIHNPRLFGNETFQPRRAKPPAPLRIPPPRPRPRTGRIDQNAISRPFQRRQRPPFLSLIPEEGFEEEPPCTVRAGPTAGNTA